MAPGLRKPPLLAGASGPLALGYVNPVKEVNKQDGGLQNGGAQAYHFRSKQNKF